MPFRNYRMVLRAVYSGTKGSLAYWATTNRSEVDFIFWRGQPAVAIEVKQLSVSSFELGQRFAMRLRAFTARLRDAVCRPNRAGFELLRRTDAEQITHESAVQEMQLRRLDQPLTDVAEERGDARDDIAGFEDSQPALRSVVRSACIGPELREIDELTGACVAAIRMNV